MISETANTFIELNAIDTIINYCYLFWMVVMPYVVLPGDDISEWMSVQILN